MHMPGHKASEAFLKSFPQAEVDITELPFSDNLLQPEGMIAEAQDAFARVFGVPYARFVTSGSTVSLQILIHASKRFGSLLAIGRNAHKSVYHACELFGITPVVLEDLSEAAVEEVFQKESGLSGILVTRPDYYGNCISLAPLRKLCDRYGKLLIVDQAQGAHFGLHPALPDSAIEADGFVISAHKTLPALTPASVICVRSASYRDAVEKSFLLIHTTSPSYPIMASIDYARAFVEEEGEVCFSSVLGAIAGVKTDLVRQGVPVQPCDDPTRLHILLNGKISADDLLLLCEQCGCYPEILSEQEALFLFSMTDGEKEAQAVKKMCLALAPYAVAAHQQAQPVRGERVMPYLQAAVASQCMLLPEEAVGRISAADVGVYPPATPLVLKGERITAEAVAYLSGRRDTFGLVNGKIATVDCEE
ncbi:MAG: hypothetical protein IJF71_01725 [Clostridia bacterium]|nr:hypothetical protein [Clostridia bacterium]